MILFLKVFFWISVLDISARLLNLSFVSYPRKTSRGLDALNVALNGFFMAWAWYLVWGV